MAEETNEETRSVTVICGANTQILEDMGGDITVGELRSRLADVMNIPEPSQAIIGGQSVGDNHTLQAGDQVEFVKPAGSKGK